MLLLTRPALLRMLLLAPPALLKQLLLTRPILLRMLLLARPALLRMPHLVVGCVVLANLDTAVSRYLKLFLIFCSALGSRLSALGSRLRLRPQLLFNINI